MLLHQISVLFVAIAMSAQSALAESAFAGTGNAEDENSLNQPAASEKLVIAHRGASGYLPEHTLAAKAMAYAMGADYIEQDVVMTRDDHLIVLHDPFLDRVTNVTERFPKRFREFEGSKRWLAIDFTLEEIQSLEASQSFSPGKSESDNNAGRIADYPSRFPIFSSSFQVPTLQQEIELIQGLNHSTGKDIGIYVEIKAPWLHQIEGKDISHAVLSVLKEYGYQDKQDKAFVQCFDPDEVRRIHEYLMPELNVNLKLVQLIAPSSWGETRRLVNGKFEVVNNDWMLKPGAMQKLSGYVDGVGPWKSLLLENAGQAVEGSSGTEAIRPSKLLTEAKATDLMIHPFTFRKDPGKVPAYARDFEHLLEIFLYQLGVDGVFTDFPDIAAQVVSRRDNTNN